MRSHLPAPGRGDSDMLARARRPGRVRGISFDLWRAVGERPTHAGRTLASGLRAATALHSRERRFVAELLWDLVRWGRLAGEAFRARNWDERYEAWLDHLEQGVDLAAVIPEDPVSALALAADVPPEIAASLVPLLGGAAGPWLAASNQRAPVGLRLDPRLGDRKSWTNQVFEAGITVREGTLSPRAVIVPAGTDVRNLPGASQGLVSVQDEGSQHLAERLGVKPGDDVLDLCAGGGGKTLVLAAALCGNGRLVACDVRDRALAEAKRRLADAGYAWKGLSFCPPDRVDGRFDRVLVDAPCSGLGVLRREPDRRWRTGDLARLLPLQAKILDEAASRTRPGGRMVYATCSVLPEENEQQVAAFLERHPTFSLQDAWRGWPHVHGTDGFYAATLRHM